MAGFADLILSYSPVRTAIGHSTARSTHARHQTWHSHDARELRQSGLDPTAVGSFLMNEFVPAHLKQRALIIRDRSEVRKRPSPCNKVLAATGFARL